MRICNGHISARQGLNRSTKTPKAERIMYILTILRNTDRNTPLCDVEKEINEAFRYLEEYREVITLIVAASKAKS